jgi:hypothetical protein
MPVSEIFHIPHLFFNNRTNVWFGAKRAPAELVIGDSIPLRLAASVSTDT